MKVWNFNETLTNYVVSFEQPGPALATWTPPHFSVCQQFTWLQWIVVAYVENLSIKHSYARTPAHTHMHTMQFYLTFYRKETSVNLLYNHTERNNQSNWLMLSQFVFKKVIWDKPRWNGQKIEIIVYHKR